MTHRWKPNVTVAGIIARDDHFLLVEEHTSHGLQLNNPAGHLDPGETLVQACIREVLEETTHPFTPSHLVGVYLTQASAERTYLRFAFCGEVGAAIPERALDKGIVRYLWMPYEAIVASQANHRSGAVLQCIDDYRRGQRFGLELLNP